MPVTLQDLGWNDHFQRAFDAVAKPGWMPGRLIRETKINFTALLDGGEDVDAVVSGKLWHDAATDAELPAVGDWVAIDPGEAGDEAVIRSILPRQTCFSRKAPGKSSAEQVLGTNVDIVAVVTEPGTDFNPRRMERYFTLIRRSGASPLILLNKTDLFSREEVEKAMQILRELSPECAIISISALHNRGITEFRKCLSKGKTICIVGSSGVGKSTLAKVLAGIEKADSGEIYLDDENITGYDIDHRANAGIGYAFQQPPRFKGMTVARMLSLAAGKNLTEKESCDLLSAVGLCSEDYLNRQLDGTLSGGEMKRIEIATVLAKSHKVSIFDEPEAGIDLWSFSMLIKRFEEIHKEKKECLILISHQERIIQMADKIMVIEDGQVKEYGTKEDVLPTLFQQKTGRMCGQEGGTC